MDLSQLPQWKADPALKDSMLEKATILRRLVGTLAVLIAGTFLLMLWVLGSPDSHQEHVAATGPSSTWPDGSAKTPQDWWAKAKGGSHSSSHQVAQPPATAPAQGQPNRG